MNPVAVVTGARGFIGAHLCRFLSESGFAVHGLGHGAWPEADASAWGISSWQNGEVNGGNLRALQLRAGAPRVIFHLAGGSSVAAAIAAPREDFYRTVATTAELLEWMRTDSPASRLVVVSSAAVYGAGHEGPLHETAPLRPFSPYGHHKRMMEDLCASYRKSYGLDVRVARLFSVYGPGLMKQLLWDTCSRLDAGARELELGGTGTELRDWTEISDVVRALLVVGEQQDLPDVTNVGSGVAMPVRDVVDALMTEWVSMGGKRVPVRYSGVSRAGDPHSLVADGSLLAGLGFRWAVTPQRGGFARYVHWFLGRPRNTA